MAQWQPTLPTLSPGADQETLRRFVWQLVDQLRYVLANLDEENLSESYLKTVTSVTRTAGEALTAVRAVESASGQALDEIRDRLVATADEITRNTETLVTATAESLTQSVATHYTARTDTEALEETLRSLIVQTATDVTYRFETAQQYTSDVAQALADYEAEVASTLRISEDGLTLGRTDSPFTARLDNNRLAFLQDGVEVAYISNNKLYITHAHVTQRLTLGTLETSVTTEGVVSRWIN